MVNKKNIVKTHPGDEIDKNILDFIQSIEQGKNNKASKSIYELRRVSKKKTRNILLRRMKNIQGMLRSMIKVLKSNTP